MLTARLAPYWLSAPVLGFATRNDSRRMPFTVFGARAARSRGDDPLSSLVLGLLLEHDRFYLSSESLFRDFEKCYLFDFD